MKIKQISEFDTGLKTRAAKKADKDQKKLIEINHNKKRIFVVGNLCSGTRWLNYLIIKNTPTNHCYALRNQHQYLDDNNNIKSDHKHGILKEELLNQKNIVIIYIIRDFDTFLNSCLRIPYGECWIGIRTNMKLYQRYCHMIESNISLLRNSESNYIIVSMKQIQKTKGKSLLNILETHGFEFRKPYDFLDKHTKTRKTEQNQNHSKHKSHLINKITKNPVLIWIKNVLKQTEEKWKFERNNIKIENILKNLDEQPEIKISWK